MISGEIVVFVCSYSFNFFFGKGWTIYEFHNLGRFHSSVTVRRFLVSLPFRRFLSDY